jgi:hypothetical protein
LLSPPTGKDKLAWVRLSGVDAPTVEGDSMKGRQQVPVTPASGPASTSPVKAVKP